MDADRAGVVTSSAERKREGWADVSRGSASWFTFFSADMTPTSAMSAGLMEIPARGGVLKPHQHQQAEIYYVADGTGLLTIDGVTRPISAGMAAFIPGDAEHALRNESGTVLRIFYVFPTDRFDEVVYRFPD